MFSNTDRIYDLEQVRSADAPYIGSLSSTADKPSAWQRAVQDDWLRVDLSALALCTIATSAARFRLIVPIRQTTDMAVHAVGYTYTLHRHHHARSDDPRSGASGVLIAGDHNGTHIDALCHQAESMTMHGGVQVDGCVQTSTGFAAMGAETIEPILGRGVLLDVARHDGVPFLPLETLVSRDHLEAVAAAQGTPINSGDVVLVRTGAGAIWDTPADYIRAAGIAADASAWLADLGVRAVGADNIAWDLDSPKIDPTTETSFPGHVILLVRHGIHIIENLYLEELAHDRVYAFTFICLPPKLKGAAGAPVRPVAVVRSS